MLMYYGIGKKIHSKHSLQMKTRCTNFLLGRKSHLLIDLFLLGRKWNSLIDFTLQAIASLKASPINSCHWKTNGKQTLGTHIDRRDKGSSQW